MNSESKSNSESNSTTSNVNESFNNYEDNIKQAKVLRHQR